MAKTSASPLPEMSETTLSEFCIHLSQSDRRVELIGAFHASETAAGRVKDSSSAFSARFAEFVNKPV